MSTIPSRTRSLRKPSEIGTRYGRPGPVDHNEKNASVRSSATAEKTPNDSPSRLPVKPTTRPLSLHSTRLSSISGPPSATGSSFNKTYVRPPSANSTTSKPHATELQRRSSTSHHAPQAPITEPAQKDRSRPPLVQSKHLRNPSTTSISATDRSTPQLTQSRHLRNVSNASTSGTLSASARVSGHTRTKSSSTFLTSSSALRQPLDLPSTRILRSDSQPKKPTFSTLQQHFSPAKNLAPKPHPAAFLAPPSPSKLPSNIAISAETSKLQNELLQLHLLHKDSALVDKKWRASAKKKLGNRFQQVVQRNDALVQIEVDKTGKVNAAALRKWEEESTPGWGLEEKIQIVNEIVTGVWNLGEHGGKYSRLVRKFERWLSRCQGVLSARNEDELKQEDIIFLEELEQPWKDECANLGRRLESWREHFRDLGDVDKGSSLAIIIDDCRALVKGMSMELSVMSSIERGLMEREKDWIKKVNDEGIDDDEEGFVAGACWRAR